MPKPRIKWSRVLSKALLVLVGIIFFLPFVWMFFSSLKPSTEVLSSGSELFGSRLEWANYLEAFTAVPYGRILLNTFGIAAAGFRDHGSGSAYLEHVARTLLGSTTELASLVISLK